MKLLPIRICAGWNVRWNHLEENTNAEIFLSEDLLWLQHMDRNNKPDDLFIDVGWYRDTYKAVLNDNWDHDKKPYAEFLDTDVNKVIEIIEDRMFDQHKLKHPVKMPPTYPVPDWY